MMNLLEDGRFAMKYPLHTQSKPVSGVAAKKLLEAIDTDGTVVNERMIALAKRIAARRRQTQVNYVLEFGLIMK